MATLNDILLDSASYLDLDATLPTGTELTTRIRFGNLAINEWSESYKWRQLKVEYTPTFTSFASLAITNFKTLNGPPVEYISAGVYTQYPEIAPEDRFSKGISDKYSYITGNDGSGFAIHFNGINVNATLTIPYVRSPSAMATLTDVCEVPDAQFVTSRVISYVLQARNDERFPVVLADGNRLLSNMIGQEMVALPGGLNSIPKKGIASYSIGG